MVILCRPPSYLPMTQPYLAINRVELASTYKDYGVMYNEERLTVGPATLLYCFKGERLLSCNPVDWRYAEQSIVTLYGSCRYLEI
jgi:hypothetical protein